MRIEQITQLAIEAQPLDVVTVRQRLRLEAPADGEEDTEGADIALMIASAVALAEQRTRRSYATQRLRCVFGGRPMGMVRLPRPPTLDVVSVAMIDADGDEVALEPLEYRLRRDHLLPTDAWSADARGLVVEYRAGVASLPPTVLQYVLLHVGEAYKNREASADRTMVALPHIEHLLAAHVLPMI